MQFFANKMHFDALGYPVEIGQPGYEACYERGILYEGVFVCVDVFVCVWGGVVDIHIYIYIHLYLHLHLHLQVHVLKSLEIISIPFYGQS